MPDVSDKVNEALALMSRGELARAKSTLQRALRQASGDADANASLAEVLAAEGDFCVAAFYARRAAESRGATARHWTVLGHVLCSNAETTEGVSWLARSCAANPDAAENWELLARGHLLGERFEEALCVTEEGLARHPRSPRLHLSRSQACRNTARSDEGIAALRAGLAFNPGNVELESSLAIALLYRDDASEAQVLAAHRAHAATLEAAVRAQAPARPAPTVWSGSTPLRIGFMSPDLRQHSAAYFIEPMLRNFDRTRVHVTCYSTCPTGDDITARLRPLASVWRDVATSSPLDLADRIRADGIHVLVDLCGLMAGQRLSVMAMRPASVLASYLGYPASLGLSCVDVRLVDAVTDPAETEAWCTERLVRLDPCFLCYAPPREAPVLPGPREPGPIRFGSFNALQKISPSCAALWAGVLARVPDSRLLLKPGRDSQRGARSEITRMLVLAGVDAARVEFLDRTAGVPEHLAQYARIDVALDTVPYHGTTTTCEALWMGIPVVSRTGEGHRSRVGASLLRTVGLAALVANDEAGFVAKAAGLAAAPDRLAGMRSDGPSGLRTMMRDSPLCDGAAHAARFVEALEREAAARRV